MPDIANLLIALPGFLLAVTVHEFTHGYLAYRKGDHTAALQGRLTLNPVKHIDPVGTLLFPVLLALLRSPFIFGWAKPVPVNPYNFRNPRRDNMVVALGGPVSNFLLALLLGLALKAMQLYPGMPAVAESTLLYPLHQMIRFGFEISIVLGVFNLIPVHPLDGSHIMEGLLSPPQAMAYRRLAPYGFLILIALMVTGIFQRVLFPVSDAIALAMARLLGI